MFNFTAIQTGRNLSNDDVIKINHLIKQRAHRYVAAVEKEWLYPEKFLRKKQWDSFGEEYLLMPDPRSVTFSSEILIGFKDGSSDAFDEFGRKPWQAGYRTGNGTGRDMETSQAFKGEYARIFGPCRRGRSFELGKISDEEDSPEFHKYHLSLEKKNKKYRYNK